MVVQNRSSSISGETIRTFAAMLMMLLCLCSSFIQARSNSGLMRNSHSVMTFVPSQRSNRRCGLSVRGEARDTKDRSKRTSLAMALALPPLASDSPIDFTAGLVDIASSASSSGVGVVATSSPSGGVELLPSVAAPLKEMLQALIVERDYQKFNAAEHSFVSSTAQSLLNALDSFTLFFNGIFANPSRQQVLGSPFTPSIDALLQQKFGPVSHLVPPDGSQQGAFLFFSSISSTVVILASAVITYFLLAFILNLIMGSARNSSPPPNAPYPLGRYDAKAARAYFDERWGDSVARAFQIGIQSAWFGFSILADYLGKKLDVNADKRALALSLLLTQLGPSFIKIGQSLSIRTDLLSPAYVRGLKTLQDQVAPFSTLEARSIIEQELGRPVTDVFLDFGSEPVAAASLGQVYRAKLRNDPDKKEVAIKVQRPNIMNQIALDMHIIREFAPILKRVFKINTDLVGTVDAWGRGFVDELDYIAEAQNAEYFTESIQDTPLANVVFAPPVMEEYTTGKVLTTEWVVGERLDKSLSEDVTILCSIAMNTYLTMMLETGVLHCDPHPGNLFRTADGKLCILDWGMVTRLDEDLQVTLIEHMAHLTSADYDEIPRDLLLLGFIPPSKADAISDSGLVQVLAGIYGTWTKGGGVAAFNVNEVVAQLQDLTAKKGNMFQIPPYFAYIAKTFSVLEGIGLSNDPSYSIIKECLPYVSKRLLTDHSERTGGALSTFIFGPNKSDKDRIIDYNRVEQLIQGFGEYTTSASGARLGKQEKNFKAKSRTDVIEDLANQILDLLVTEEETPLQKIFVEQLAKIISSSSRSFWTELRERSGTLPSGRTVLGTLVDPLGLFRTSPIVRMNALDEKTVKTTRNLIALLQKQTRSTTSTPNNDNLRGVSGRMDDSSAALDASSLSGEEVLKLSRTMVNKLWIRRRGIMKTGNRLANMLLRLTADKLEKGERETLVLPSPRSRKEVAVENEGHIRVSGRKERHSTDFTTAMTTPVIPSQRLAGARRILADVEKEEMEDELRQKLGFENDVPLPMESRSSE